MGLRSKMCSACHRKYQAKNIPPKHELIDVAMSQSACMSSIGEVYGVSDNAVRKWLNKYEMPTTSKGLKEAVFQRSLQIDEQESICQR